VSGIIDRLKSVEGVTSAQLGGEPDVRSDAGGPADADRTLPPRTANFTRVVAILVVISIALFGWRFWNRHTENRSSRSEQTALVTVDASSPVEGRQLASSDARPAPPAEPSLAVPQADSMAAAVEEQPLVSALSGPDGAAASSNLTGPHSAAPIPVAPESPSQGGQSSDVADTSSGEAYVSSEKTGTEGTPSSTPPVSQGPMKTPRTVEPALTPQEDQKTKSFLLGLKVSGVYKDARGYVALIDGRECQKGDTFGQIEIVQITSQRVTFACSGKRYHLPIR
jgi:hypothetical protein